MKPEELRLGNYVNYQGRIQKVTGLDKTVVYLCAPAFDDKSYPIPVGSIKPIPITEEWLLKFGFDKAESKFTDKPEILTKQISNINYLDYEDDSFAISGVSGHVVTTFWNDIKFVHQLQNLYYALTEEELQFKELAK